MEWICVSDKLPDEGRLVISTSVSNNWVGFCIMKDGEWFASDEINTFQAMPVYPSHWCEIPEPPKQTDNE